MRLIEKIILILLGVSLLPLLLAGVLLYFSVQHTITQQVTDHLSAIATIEQSRITGIETKNQKLLMNFTNRVSLRNTLDHYNRSGGASQDQLQLIASLDTTLKTDSTFARITLMNPTGQVVASTDRSLVGSNLATSDLFLLGRTKAETVLESWGMGQNPLFYLSSPLLLNGNSIGVVTMEVKADELLALVQDYTGLGSTGEVVLAQKLSDGTPVYITPLRFDGQAAFNRIVAASNSPTLKALAGQEMTFSNATDYRNTPVLAVTRYIPSTGWGLVVKIDRTEAFAPSDKLRSEFLLLAFMSSTIVIFAAIALAERVAQPILDIDEVAEEVSRGKLSTRVPLSTKDEIGNLASTFNDMLDNLEMLDDAKSEFVSLASHQLRTPASGVKALTELLLNGYAGQLTDKQRGYLQQVFDGNERQLRVINDLLNVAMLEAGRLQLKKTLVDLPSLIEATVTEMNPVILLRKQNLTVSKPDHPITIEADGDKLRMVLDNLVSNASKYTQEGGDIKLSLHSSGTGVSLSVADTGVGIKKQDLKKLFQKFSQVNNHIDDPQGGSAGLGLYIVKKIVELHKGHIRVDSTPGKGTTFIVELPKGAA